MKTLLTVALLTVGPLASAPLSLDVVKNTARVLDGILIDGQKAKKIATYPLSDDATFLRRAYLNIIGRLPSYEESRNFLDSPAAGKRSNLIERLITSPGVNTKLFNFWSDLLRVETNKDTHGLGWHLWLHDAVEKNVPYDKMVHSMLSAKGHVAENPAVGYYLRDRGMLLENVSNTVQIFLGQQIGCAQCHDHPFDTVTQMEYYELASFLGSTDYRFTGGREKIAEILGLDPGSRDTMMGGSPRTRKKDFRRLNGKNKTIRKQARDLNSIFRYHNRNAIADNSRRKLKLPDDYKYEDGEPGEVIEPQTLFGQKLENIPPGKRREAFATWVTSRENPYFTKVIANRLWDYVFGYGIIPTLDDWSNAPDPLYPELIAAIEKAMKATNYDVKEFLRILYHTQLFQRTAATSEPQPGFVFDFSGPVLRRLDAEEIRDSFVTLHSGVVDANRNTSLKKSWKEYTRSFDYIMNASTEEIKEINKATDKAQRYRQALGGKLAKLRTQARKAKTEGNKALLRELNKKMTQIRRETRRKTMQGEPGSAAARARAASKRRLLPKRPTYSPFKLRSSELPAPAGGGSIVREFGGSDRKTPDAGNTHATIPQTLRLLNGNETSLLTSQRNNFAQKLRNLTSSEERLNYLFLSLYSAYPTAKEKKAFLPETRDNKSTAVLARAMLTSNRFLFVQ